MGNASAPEIIVKFVFLKLYFVNMSYVYTLYTCSTYHLQTKNENVACQPKLWSLMSKRCPKNMPGINSHRWFESAVMIWKLH